MVNLSIKKLNVFIAVADCGSFSEGARKTFITQPAAASIIDEIEAIVGQNLFNRNGKIRRAILTEKGQQAYDAFACAVRAYDDAIATLFAESNQRKKQRILIQSSYVDIVSTDWLTHMLNNSEKMHVVIEQGSWREIASAVEDAQDCIAFLDGDVKFKRGEFISLGQSDLVLALPCNESDSMFVGRDTVTWEDIPENSYLFTGICPQCLQQVYSQLRSAHREVSRLVEVGCAAVLGSYLQHGEAPALVPRSLLPALGQGGEPVRYLALAYSKVFVPFGLYIPHGNHLRRLLVGKGRPEYIVPEWICSNNEL